MKILIITKNPERASFRQRISVYLNDFEKNGISCSFSTLPSNFISRTILFCKTKSFDCVLLQKKGLNFWDAFWLKKFAHKIIYNFDDAIMYDDKQPEKISKIHFRPWKRSVEKADLIITGSRYLAEHAYRFNTNVRIIPIGLDISDYEPSTKKGAGDRIRLVWIGSKSTLPYLIHKEKVLEKICSKYPNVILRIISDDFAEFKNVPTEKILWSKENRKKYLADSDIGLAPLPDDNFSQGKCSFKVLEYSASRLPVVASPVGTNIDNIIDGKTGYLAKSEDEWFDKLSILIENKSVRLEMGTNGAKYAQNFDSKIISRQFSQTIKSVCEKNVIQGNPLISVCIPTYNRKDYLKQTIDSVLGQSYRNLEIIVVDDGSTDGTQEMVKQYNFPITYLWQKNKGDATARNKLIELAKGDYISFLDSDDLLLPDALERLVAAAANQPDTMSYGSYYRIDENGRIYGKCKRKLYSGRITEKLFKTIIVHSCGSIFPRKILAEDGGFDIRLKNSSDYKKWLNLSTKYNFVAVEEPTFKRRRHLGNISKPRFEVCKTEYGVLLDFYNSNKELISDKIAKLTLAKSARRCSRHALHEKKYSESTKFSKISLTHKIKIKTLFCLAIAFSMKKLSE